MFKLFRSTKKNDELRDVRQELKSKQDEIQQLILNFSIAFNHSKNEQQKQKVMGYITGCHQQLKNVNNQIENLDSSNMQSLQCSSP